MEKIKKNKNDPEPEPISVEEQDRLKEIEHQKELREYKDLKLSFCREPSEKTQINFIPLIYQESQNLETNKLLVYDIFKNTFEINQSCNPALNCQKYLYEDDQQFNVFVLCRTTDVFNDKDNHVKRQRAKYQIFSFYTEKLGRFEAKEVLLTHTSNSIEVQTIGMKNILLSKKIIQKFDW